MLPLVMTTQSQLCVGMTRGSRSLRNCFKRDEDLQYIGRKFVNKTIFSEEFQN